MDLRIMTWNIWGRASFGWEDNKNRIQETVVDKIIEQKANVIVLTEFVLAPGIDYLFNRFQEEGYIWFQQSRSGKNGILIAINRNVIAENKLNFHTFRDCISSNIDDCNILKVYVPLKNGKYLCVVGCRMEVELDKGKDLHEKYDSMRDSFDKILVPCIKEIREDADGIVCGDFNNARCLGDLNKKFNMDDYSGKAQRNYNLNYIKDEFAAIDYVMADSKNGNPMPTCKGYPDDHIFIKGGRIESCESIEVDRLSDHKILNCTWKDKT